MTITEIFCPFILKHCEAALLQLLQESDIDKHYGIPVSIARLAAFDHGAVDMVIASPRALLPFLDAALVKAQTALLQNPLPDRHLLSVKENVHARLTGISLFLDKAASPQVSPTIGDVSAAHIDKLLTIRGTIVRAGTVKLLEARRLYECTRCKHRFVVAADLEQGATVQLPNACPSQKENPCKGISFRHCEEVSLYTNYQEIQVQEGRQCLTVGSTPRTLTVVLQDELADSCHVGEAVEVSGIVMKQWGPTYPGIRCHVGLALQATALNVAEDRRTTVEVTPEAAQAFKQYWESNGGNRQNNFISNSLGTPLAARDAILAGFCPQLCGLFSVKLASMLMLIGGLHKRSGSEGGGGDGRGTGGGTRGEIHFLLVGDPGTGKSQIQRYVSRLAPRAVVTSGKSSSAAGLTAAAIKDGPNWTLEAGALVLADGGVCCIDEFDSVREADRAALHEAMEQQTCSVAKAGLVTTLHTRASVFGTCNPRGHRRYNPRRPLSEQLDISGPLLSRFDIVLLLLDDMNPIWDEAVANHILKAHSSYRNNNIKRGNNHGLTPSSMTTTTATPLQPGSNNNENHVNLELLPYGENNISNKTNNAVWNVESLRQYISWVKSTFHPTMTSAAEQVLSGYYQLRRGAAGRHAARTTLRLLESLVRLAQAHARLMAKETVEVMDAVTAVALVDSSVVDGESVLGLSAELGIGIAAAGDQFQERPDEAYLKLEAAVLSAVQSCVGGPPGLLGWQGGTHDWD
jgi:DNA helicase MCM9